MDFLNIGRKDTHLVYLVKIIGVSWPQVFFLNFEKKISESLKRIIVSSSYYQFKVKGQCVVSDRALEARALVEAIKVDYRSGIYCIYMYMYMSLCSGNLCYTALIFMCGLVGCR